MTRRVRTRGLASLVPGPVREAVGRLTGAGHRTLLAGGSVRDLCLGREVKDYDVATTAPPEEIRRLLPHALPRGEKFLSFSLPLEKGSLEVTTFRREGPYLDGRHPSWVEATGTEQEDVLRRDFTVNAVYLDVDADSLVDPVGGVEDLRRGLLRAVGEPLVRLEEDHLRSLRAVRFLARYGLSAEERLEKALRETAEGLRRLSADRVRQELTLLLLDPSAGRGVLALVDLGLAAPILPEVAALKGVPQPPQFHPEGDVLVHTALVLDRLPRRTEPLVWAGLLHDVGKPSTLLHGPDRIRFPQHDKVSEAMARDVLERLRAPGALVEAVAALVREHIRIASLPAMRPARRNRFLLRPDVEDHLALHEADCLASHGDLSILRFARDALSRLPGPGSPRLVRGEDVLAMGVPPGPTVGRALRAVEERILAGELEDREEALAALAEEVARLRASGGVKGGPEGDR